MRHPDDVSAIKDVVEALKDKTPLAYVRVTPGGYVAGRQESTRQEIQMRGLVQGVKPSTVAASSGLLNILDLSIMIPGGLGFEPGMQDSVMLSGKPHKLVTIQRGPGFQEPVYWTLVVRRG